MTRGLMLVIGIAAVCAACGDRAVSGPTAPARTATETPAAPAPPPIQTAHPEMRTRLAVLETSGKVAFNEERLVRVHAPVTGRVIEVQAKPGDVVEPGARLFVIDSPDLSAAKAEYAKAVADLERAEKALGLVRELVEAKAVAQKELRDAENEYRKAQAERERAAARLRTLGVVEERFRDIAMRADAGTTVTVTAPRSGVVIERNITPGQVVAYGQADAPLNLFVIANLSTMWVLADVYEPDVPRVRVGQTVTVTLPCCPGERYEGTVTYIADAVDPQTRTLKVRAVVPNRGRALKAEMFAKVTLATTATRVLAVPQTAVHRDDGKPFVLVQGGTAEFERRPVTLGADLGEWIEIAKGVGPSDTVVTTGGILLKRTVN
jgi:cobalt-zinc-cadmium efflux system membrane fusion protein